MNQKFTLEKFDFEIIESETGTCKIKFASSEGLAFQKERRKLYIVQSPEKIFYVGEANTSIKTRFSRGCSSFNFYVNNNREKSRRGYKGYKWLDKLDNPIQNLITYVMTFDSSFDHDREIVEAIEGELVYLIRNSFGYWPLFQNEIHFRNENIAKEIAVQILNEINTGSKSSTS